MASRRDVLRNAADLVKHGCSSKQIADLRAHCRRLGVRGIHRERQPIGAFNRQRQNARHRGIEWQIKLWEWWTIWDESGHWDARGRGDGYVMCRHGDVGPYSAANVFIGLARVNNSERSYEKKSGLPMGVIRTGKRYGAHCMKSGKMRWLGTFGSPEEAELAYLIEVHT